MTKVYCSDAACQFNGEEGVCTLKKIALSWHSIATVNSGRQEFNRCNMYQKSERYKKIEEFMKEHPFKPEEK